LNILDRGHDAFEGLTASWEMVRGNRISMVIISVGILLIVLISIIPLGLGLVVSIP
jgi:uncharacterized membrane protein